MILTLSHIGNDLIRSAASAESGPTGFSGVAPGGPLLAIGAAVTLLVLGILAAVVTLRGPKRGTEGARRARRGLGADALAAAARELRPSLTGAPVPHNPDPARPLVPRQLSARPTNPLIPEEVRAWQSRRESR